jgi:MoaA/NifB/PqqE/SkfB family radical SAM enzyme
MNVSFVTGFSKRAFDVGLSLRIAGAAAARFGLFGAVGEFARYLRDNRNVFGGTSDRYVRRGRDVYVAGALPPLSSRVSVDYLLDEIQTFNHRQLAPMVMALLSVTSRCPYRCRYCYALDELRQGEAVPAEALARAVGDLGRMRIPTVFLTGGELMMRREELPVILAPAREHGTAVYLVSSGWGMDRAALEALLPYNVVGVVVSLDSRREDRVREAKGHPDAFAHALAAIRAAREVGLLVGVDCIATTEILEDFEAYVDFLSGLEVHFVNFLAPHRVGGVEKLGFPVITTDQFKVLEALMQASNRGRVHRGRPIAYSPMVWEHSRGCVAGQQFVYVDPLGNVRPCPFLQETAGNIRDTPLSEIVSRVHAGGERRGCFSFYERLPSRTRLGNLPKSVEQARFTSPPAAGTRATRA